MHRQKSYRKSGTYPSERSVGIAEVGIADVPAVVSRGGGGSQVDRIDAVIEVALDVQTVVRIESDGLGVGVAREEQRHANIGARAGLQGEGRSVGRAGGLQVPGQDTGVANGAVGGLLEAGGVEVEDVGAGEVLVAEAEAFDSGAFVAGVESTAVESLVCGRLDDQVEGRGGDVVVWLLGGGQGHRGGDGCEESGLHDCSLVLVVLSGLVWRDVGASRSGKWRS
jgi:hypothetical protein